MRKTITVKGIGMVSVTPDYVILTIALQSKGRTYEAAMESAAERVGQMQGAIGKIGFAAEELKTTSFEVGIDYESRKKQEGGYEQTRTGYICEQRLQLAFDFDSKKLTAVLRVISASGANPELDIRFTIKSPERIKSDLLQSAAVNAQAKAETLCQASGVKLGDLVNIDYNWGEINIYSNTRYEVEKECLPMMALDCCTVPNITPNDIKANDTVSFMWEIL